MGRGISVGGLGLVDPPQRGESGRVDSRTSLTLPIEVIGIP